ncbi:MAG: hypothetical protein methR_P1614 [Methyloprofundus sp.]|nr:MAG: hypothetical protein methR_P1614 [Methyloprofundus sp.]
MGVVKYYWEWLLLFVGLFYWAVASMTVSLLGTVLIVILPQKMALACGRFLLSKVFQIFIGFLKICKLLILDDAELQSLAGRPEGLIIAPNHTALWDVVYIAAKIPEAVCVIKGSILMNPFLGGGARLAGYIPINSISQMLKIATQRLKQDETLLMFPEGTRTKTDAQWINPLKGGVALLAKRTKVPVVPIFIRSNSRFYEKGWPLYKKPEFPLKICINVGEPICVAENESAQAFGQRLENIYLTELAKPHPLRRVPNTES